MQSRTEFGCPYDCGLCPDHEQHTCLALIDVNEACNLTCPVCFADSSPERTAQRSLAEIEFMLDALVASEGVPDLLQISGGEPTIHPQILDIIALAKAKPIRHIMLNTNGIRIAREPDFAAALAEFKPGFEVYLQFDSLRAAALKTLRGADLSRIRLQALEALERAWHLDDAGGGGEARRQRGRDRRDHRLRAWLELRARHHLPADPGRRAERELRQEPRPRAPLRHPPRDHRRRHGVSAGDIIPLPCNPESIAIGYALRKGRNITPITSFFPKDKLVDAVPNAITFEKYPELHRQVFEFFSLATTQCNTPERLEALLCCLPEVPVPQGLGYENIFRLAIVEFLDAHNFCLGRVKRSCIHFLTPNGQIIPFDTYNLFYRNGRIDGIRQRLRENAGGVLANV